VVLAGVAIFVYPGIFKLDRLEKLKSSDERISVAVMPFQNITNDDTKNFWQEIIQDNLITSLSNSAELKVRQKESINTLLQSNDLTNYASITSSIASNISQKLNARVFVHGSISQIGTIIRINARLIDSKTEEVVISFQIDGTAENILNMTDSLSVMLKNYLVVTLMKKEVSKDFQRYLGSTKSPEALRYYIDGHNAFFEGDFRSAIEMFHHAIEIDSNFITPMIFLAVSYGNQSLYEDAKKWSLKAYEKRDNVPRIDKVFAEQIYATYCGSLIEAIKYLRQMLDIDDQQAAVYYELGVIYDMLGQHVKAIPEYEKSLEIFNRWDIKPMWINNYTALGHDYHKTGQDKKEKKLYKRAEQDFPDNQTLIYRQTILALSEGKTNNANDYIEKYCSLLEGKSYSEAAITSNLGFIYWDARLFDKAEEYLRRALSLEPEKSLRLNNLACLLIENNINIDEGIELVDKALKLSPDNYEYLDTKGWGIYKQGKYRHALEILQKSWDLRMENAIYDHEAFLHLQETKKAVASMTPQPDF
jgi:tetratricopeptide (TPR) repeat protein